MDQKVKIFDVALSQGTELTDFDFNEIEKEINDTQYGIQSVLPHYIKEAIEYIKCTTSKQFEQDVKMTILELLHLKQNLASREEELMESAPPHIRSLYSSNGVNILLERALFERALARADDAHIIANRFKIRRFIELQRSGFPTQDSQIPETGFWQSRSLSEMIDKADMMKASSGPERYLAPSSVPWYEKSVWLTMMQKVKKQMPAVWKPMRVADLARVSPIDFPVVQKQTVRVCANYSDTNNSKTEYEKIRMLGTRAAAEIIQRCLARNSIGNFMFATKKGANSQVDQEKQFLRAMEQGKQIVGKANGVSDTKKGVLINDAEPDEEENSLPRCFVTDWSGWRHQSPAQLPNYNSSWLPILPQSPQEIKDCLGPDCEIVEKKFFRQKRFLNGIDRLDLFSPHSNLNEDGSIDFKALWTPLKSEVMAFGDLLAVHACLGRSELFQFCFSKNLGVPTIIWVDDGQGFARPKVIWIAAEAYAILCSLTGKTVADAKTQTLSDLQKSTTCLGLGYEIDAKAERLSIVIPEERKARFSELATETVMDILGKLENSVYPPSRDTDSRSATAILKGASKVSDSITNYNNDAAVTVFAQSSEFEKAEAFKFMQHLIKWVGDENWAFESNSRKVVFFAEGSADLSYSYGNKTHQAKTQVPGEVLEVMSYLSQKYNVSNNMRCTALLNLYDQSRLTGRIPGIPAHCDDEELFGANYGPTLVIGLSLGLDTTMIITEKSSGVKKCLRLPHASVLIMSGFAQNNSKHEIPPTSALQGQKRLSITFRWVRAGRMENKGFARTPPSRRRMDDVKMLKLMGVYRWSLQLSKAATFFAGYANTWCNPDFMRKNIQVKEQRKQLLQLVLNLERKAMEFTGVHFGADLIRNEILHTFADASGEFDEVQKFQMAHPSVAVPGYIVQSAAIWLGGFVRFKARKSGVVFARAWRMQIRSIPKFCTDISIMHIGIFEMMAILITISYSRLIGISMENADIIQHCDNLGDVFILIRGATKCKCSRAIGMTFFDEMVKNGYGFYPAWISGKRNILADAASRPDKLQLVKQLEPSLIVDELKEDLANEWWEKTRKTLLELQMLAPGGV